MAEHTATVEHAKTPEFLTRARSIALVLWRRAPFTTAVVVAMVALGLATGTLWSAVETREWFPQVSYGLPSLLDGRWWTFLIGPFFALNPLFYLPVAAGFALLVGPAEARLGTRRTAAIAVGAQLAATLGAALVLLALRGTGWVWATQLAGRTDVGFSAGGLAVVAVVSATVRSPWRLRLRALLCVYVGVSILYIGTLADVEHLLAVGFTLPLARRLAGPKRLRATGRPTRREWRLLAVTGLVIAGAVQIVVRIAPGVSPLGSTAGQANSVPELAIVLVVIALMINGLRRGKRAAWRWAVGLASLIVALGVVIAVVVVVAEIFGLAYTIENASFLIADALLWGAMLTLLIAARGAFRVRSRRKRRRALGSRDLDGATELLQRHGGGTLSWMTLWPENSHFFGPDGESYLAYRRHAGVAIALGDPIGPGTADTIRAFAELCDSSGLVPCLFSVTDETTTVTDALGWARVQVAEDTLVDLEDLEFRGKAWQNVRSALNRAVKEGVAFRLVTLADEPWSLVAQVRAISEEWVGGQGDARDGFHPRRRGRGAGPACPRRPGRVRGRRGPGRHVVVARVRRRRADRRLDARRDAPPRRRVPARGGVPHRLVLPGVPRRGREVRLTLRCPTGPRPAGPTRRAARTSPRLLRRRDGALLRVPLAARVQDTVQASLRADVPLLPRRGRPAADRRRARARLLAGRLPGLAGADGEELTGRSGTLAALGRFPPRPARTRLAGLINGGEDGMAEQVLVRGEQVRRAAVASAFGTTIEWYDYFIYSTATALVFNKLFFPSLSPAAGTLAAFATLGVGFVARPVCGIVWGHFGDRVGRKAMLVASLVLMGLATAAVGVLPTFAQAGVLASVLLVVLRVLQGISAGGEWGGAG